MLASKLFLASLTLTVLVRALKDLGFGKGSITGRIEEEADDLVERLEQKTKQPLAILDEFYVPVVGSLLAIIQGERVDPTEPRFLSMFKLWQEMLLDLGSPLIQIATGYPSLMWILGKLGLHRVGKLNDVLNDYLRPVIQEHKQTLIWDQPRDYIDKYLIEIQVLQISKM